MVCNKIGELLTMWADSCPPVQVFTNVNPFGADKNFDDAFVWKSDAKTYRGQKGSSALGIL